MIRPSRPRPTAQVLWRGRRKLSRRGFLVRRCPARHRSPPTLAQPTESDRCASFRPDNIGRYAYFRPIAWLADADKPIIISVFRSECCPAAVRHAQKPPTAEVPAEGGLSPWNDLPPPKPICRQRPRKRRPRRHLSYDVDAAMNAPFANDRNPYYLFILAIICLVGMRMSIGWYFFNGAREKNLNREFTSATFLSGVRDSWPIGLKPACRTSTAGAA